MIIETDSLTAQTATVGSIVDLTNFGVIINASKLSLAGKPNFSVVFERRDCNGVAHMIARRTIISTDSGIEEAPPMWLNVTLVNICFSDYH
ncbi:hypothetical protein LINGRAPRIM_LOCUS433 [Linum grandiflorum]